MSAKGASSREGSEVGSDNEEEAGVKSETSLEDNVELLSEKRATNREGALTKILKEMRMNYHRNFAEKMRLTLIDSFRRGLKRGGTEEQVLSAKAIAVLAITLGADAEDVYKELHATMEEVISNAEVDQVRAAALDAYGVLLFVANPDETTTILAMETFSKVFNTSVKPLELAASMRGWALLATTVNSKHVYSIFLPQYLSTFITFLQNEDVEVRVTAGECIALLFETARGEEEELVLSDISGYATIDVDDMLDTLYDLSQDKTKSRARKDKIKQKTPFKEVIATVETGESPNEVLEFKFQKFEFDSWVRILQLNAIRDALGPGLQSHFESNGLLQEIFDIQVDKDAKKKTLSQTEKRLIYSPSSSFAKARTKNLNKMRSTREHQVSDILGDAEEAI